MLLLLIIIGLDLLGGCSYSFLGLWIHFFWFKGRLSRSLLLTTVVWAALKFPGNNGWPFLWNLTGLVFPCVGLANSEWAFWTW